MENANRPSVATARLLNQLDRAGKRPAIMHSPMCSDVAWKFLVQIYLCSDEPRKISAEEIALSIDIPLNLILRIVFPLCRAGLLQIEHGETAADLGLSLTGRGYETVEAYLMNTSRIFSDARLSAVG